MKAIFKGTIIAESENTEIVEGNHYFPAESVKMEYFKSSDRRTTCPWKGEASYYHLQVGDTQKENAAWYYPQPKPAAEQITDYVAFYPNIVQIVNN
jgi:uncharacterized protein (DUF427 family)